VYISPDRQQLIGVRTARVEERPLSRTIRTVAVLAYDETRMTMIHPKISGWVDQLFVDFVGKPVRRGEPLLTIYSPALVATQREYLLALDGRRQLKSSELPDAQVGAESLIAATRDRLKLWDISDAQIAALERTGQVERTLTLAAPFNGVVLERNTFAGQYITPETSAFKIADLSTIWAIGQIFEYQLPGVQVGQTARIEFPYGQSTQALTGHIAFIYPDVDPMTRRARVRAAFDNHGFEFKPETYVTMVIEGSDIRALAVPKEAVIDTGTKRYVILARPSGYFEPRQVEIGAPADDFYPVLGGLDPGETIVTSALFLIDSETNLKSAMQAMSMSMPGMGGMEEKKGAQGIEGTGGMEGMEMPSPARPGAMTPAGAQGAHAPAVQPSNDAASPR
jgi:RND family efflux transporter MFP subunit